MAECTYGTKAQVMDRFQERAKPLQDCLQQLAQGAGPRPWGSLFQAISQCLSRTLMTERGVTGCASRQYVDVLESMLQLAEAVCTGGGISTVKDLETCTKQVERLEQEVDKLSTRPEACPPPKPCPPPRECPAPPPCPTCPEPQSGWGTTAAFAVVALAGGFFLARKVF